jgi:hypothetical protein
LCSERIVEKKIVLCKKGDEITGLDGTEYFADYYPLVCLQSGQKKIKRHTVHNFSLLKHKRLLNILPITIL